MKSSAVAAVLAACLLASVATSARHLSQETTVASVAETNGLTTLLEAATAAGLAETLSDPAFVGTVFAPTNDAFATALEQLNTTAEELAADGTLAQILQYHILPTAIPGALLVTGQPLETLLTGQTISVTQQGDVAVVAAFASQANVVQADVPAGQAVINVIDALLVPDLAALPPASAPASAPV